MSLLVDDLPTTAGECNSGNVDTFDVDEREPARRQHPLVRIVGSLEVQFTTRPANYDRMAYLGRGRIASKAMHDHLIDGLRADRRGRVTASDEPALPGRDSDHKARQADERAERDPEPAGRATLRARSRLHIVRPVHGDQSRIEISLGRGCRRPH